MGVRKLNKFLSNKGLTGEYEDLEKYVTHIKSNPSINNCRSKHVVIAIDFWLYMHKFLHSNKSTNIILAFLNQIIRIMIVGAIPIYVADGCVPSEKVEECDQRSNTRDRKIDELQDLDLLIESYSANEREDLLERKERLERQVKRVTKHEIKEIADLFEVFNIPFIRAKYEADALCSLLYKEGIITGGV